MDMDRKRIRYLDYPYYAWSLLITIIGGFLLIILIYYGYRLQTSWSARSSESVHVLLDVSQSMMIRDMAWASRLDYGKTIIKELINRSWAKRWLSIFGKQAILKIPQTHDYGSYVQILDGIDRRNLSEQWSTIGTMLDSHRSIYDWSSLDHIVIVTDGTEDAWVLSEVVLDELRSYEITTTILAVGTRDGGPIILSIDPRGNPEYRTYNWTPVIESISHDHIRDWSIVLDASVWWSEDDSVHRLLTQFDTDQQMINPYYLWALIVMLIILFHRYLLRCVQYIYQRYLV